MPKSQFVDPKKAFEPGYIHFEDIAVCQYIRLLRKKKDLQQGRFYPYLQGYAYNP